MLAVSGRHATVAYQKVSSRGATSANSNTRLITTKRDNHSDRQRLTIIPITSHPVPFRPYLSPIRESNHAITLADHTTIHVHYKWNVTRTTTPINRLPQQDLPPQP